MRIALFEPDIPPNTGTVLRLGACMGVPVDIIEPCGFPFSERSFKRAGMDYVAHTEVKRHADWAAFEGWRRERQHRLLLFTTKAAVPYLDHAFAPTDILLFGRESAGVPEDVHAAADARLLVPMAPGMRSLNVAVAAAMVLGEALRQTDRFPR